MEEIFIVTWSLISFEHVGKLWLNKMWYNYQRWNEDRESDNEEDKWKQSQQNGS